MSSGEKIGCHGMSGGSQMSVNVCLCNCTALSWSLRFQCRTFFACSCVVCGCLFACPWCARPPRDTVPYDMRTNVCRAPRQNLTPWVFGGVGGCAATNVRHAWRRSTRIGGRPRTDAAQRAPCACRRVRRLAGRGDSFWEASQRGSRSFGMYAGIHQKMCEEKEEDRGESRQEGW
jgi:hypothetical protein